MRYRRTLKVASWGRLSTGILLVALCGCALVPPNSFLDPTKVGNFPSDAHETGIRRILSPRETPPGIAGATDPVPEDLVAVYEDYRIAPGDVVAISIDGLLQAVPFTAALEVSPLGEIRIPDLGSIKITGLTEQELEQELKARLKESGLLPNPIVMATIQLKRGHLVSVMGAVGGPGQYPITDPNMRLLDLFAMVGDAAATARKAYVIRRVSEAAVTPTAAPLPVEAPPEEGWVIPPPDEEEGEQNPGDFMSALGLSAPGQEPPPEAEPLTQEELAEVMAPQSAETPPTTQAPATQAVETGQEPPFNPIVIFDPRTGEVMEQPEAQVVEEPEEAPSEPKPEEVAEDFEQPFDWEEVEDIALEQRVIAIDITELKAGNPRYNVVVRDRDVVNVPVDTGVFYIMGEVLRPGVYAFGGRDITVKQALAISGGFSPLAWPQRCELIRREPGTDKQFTRTVNLDAIFAGLEDDFYLRDDDILNVGTHIVAPFLFVIRNSFRFTYGFGFVYDRNFADKDAYGAKINPQTLAIQQRQSRGLSF